MIILMAVGAFASLVVRMTDFGFIEEEASGTWRSAGQLVLVAILLGASYKGKYEFQFRISALLLTFIEVFLGHSFSIKQ